MQLYNDAAHAELGERHPEAFGRPAHECWAGLWAVVWSEVKATFATARARRH